MRGYFTHRGSITPLRIDNDTMRVQGHFTKLMAQIYIDRIKALHSAYDLRRAANER